MIVMVIIILMNTAFVEHLAGPSPFHWSQYNISPPPSVSSSPSSSPLSSPSPPLFNYPNFVYPGVMAHHVANCQFGAAELPLMSTPVRPSKHRRSLSDGDDSSCSSGPVSRRPRSGNRRIRQGKANSKCQTNRRTKICASKTDAFCGNARHVSDYVVVILSTAYTCFVSACKIGPQNYAVIAESKMYKMFNYLKLLAQHGCPTGTTQKLQRVQNNAARIRDSSAKDDPTPNHCFACTLTIYLYKL